MTGPDGVAVAIFYEGTSGYRAPLLVPYTRWPGSPPGRLAAVVDLYIRVMNRVIPAPQLSFVVQAHAMSGPPAVVIRPFLRKQDAAARTTWQLPGSRDRRERAALLVWHAGRKVGVSRRVPRRTRCHGRVRSGGVINCHHGEGGGGRALIEDDEAGMASAFVQRGQPGPGRSLVEQAVGPRGLLNPGKKK